MWAQRSDRQPMLQQITAGRAVLSGYIEWFNANGKPFIMTREARARVLRVPRPECPRQRGPRPTGASTATGPSGSGHHADDNADESEEEDDDTEPLVRRNPPDIVVHQIVGRGDIGGIRLICLNLFLFFHVGHIF
ncbi:hypothetical protein V6N13_100451 [Hibiscus sabdariffa]